MPDFVSTMQAFLLAHREFAGPILGIIAFGELLIFFGLFFPATGLMLFTGGLIQKGLLDPVTVVAWSIGGAVLGDMITYWMGRLIGPSVLRRWPLNRDPTAIAQARLFFRKYGFLSIFIGRFLGPVRSTIPLVAGLMRMKHFNFQLANLTSALAWVPIMLLPGWFAARTIGDLSNFNASQWFGVLLAILVLTAASTVFGIGMHRRHGRARRQRRLEIRNSIHDD